MRLLPGAAHFHVTEEPAYACSGMGEHLYVEIEKENLTSDLLADHLARLCGVKPLDVGYAGRKDRHAITRQWFSIKVRSDAGLSRLGEGLPAGARVALITASRHGNKLRTGHLAGNIFRLGLADADPTVLATRLDALARQGIANRFGPQRFGVGQATLRAAAAWSRGDLDAAVAAIVDPSGTWQPGQPLPEGFRTGPEGLLLGRLRAGAAPAQALARCPEPLRKLLASAAQAAIFNAVADARHGLGLSHVLRPGDLGLAANGAPFRVTAETATDDTARAARLEVFTSAPLPGLSRLTPDPAIADEERAWSADTGVRWEALGQGGPLESPGERRALRIPFRSPPLVTSEGELTWVRFALPSGGYATEVLLQVGVELPTDRRA